ncbi:MAG TPA: response regulator, partial [bacterium]|nr:response regulator [bacterium]
LVVDDEKAILNICSRILEELGYRVITAQSGMEAVRLYQQEKPDVVMLDIQMPEMDGKQTHAALCGINPMAKIFFATGYATPDVVRDIRQNLKSTIIEKPFSIDTLSKVIRTLLDQN